jgi:hypothetical protein
MTTPEDPTFKLEAIRVAAWPSMRLVPASARREWMVETRNHFAQRCLPLLIANQSGWEILNPTPLRITWNGGEEIDSVMIESEPDTDAASAVSHFGHGIVTWILPYLFRTPAGFNLLVRGPANLPKDGIAPLEGVVETDWSPATFTMNWKLTRPGLTITFEEDEPIAMIVPTRRGELERFLPQLRNIHDQSGEQAAYSDWRLDREAFLGRLREAKPSEISRNWQGDYFRGQLRSPHEVAERHQTRLHLEPFE